MIEKQLVDLAVLAMERAYSPYSKCKVGAALLTENGKIFTGCNVENASYSATICAERNAVFKAISEGEYKFKMIAISSSKDGKIITAFPPCGICRQVMAEFCDDDFAVLSVTGYESYKRYTLKELLPFAFTSENLR